MDANGEWRKLHNEELHSLYYSLNIVRMVKSIRLRCAGHVARMEEDRIAFKILAVKPTGKVPLGRPRRRWKTILEYINVLSDESYLETSKFCTFFRTLYHSRQLLMQLYHCT